MGWRFRVVNVWVMLAFASLLAPVGAAIGTPEDEASGTGGTAPTGWRSEGRASQEDVRALFAVMMAADASSIRLGQTGEGYGFGRGTESASLFFIAPTRSNYGFEAAYPGPRDDLANVASRLEAAGWRVGESSDHRVTAARDGWRLSADMPADPSRTALVRVEQAVSGWALALAGVFWLIGALLGAGVARLVRGRLGRWGTFGFALLSVNIVVVTALIAGDLIEYFGTAPSLMSERMWGPGLFTVVGVLIVAIWLTATLIRGRGRRVTSAEAVAGGRVKSVEAVVEGE
ncbi:hypothetical protein JIG36_15275 [Actinoplanes sp. LDG1-06]|uniref:Uncharacterized protein n=1 Tax=Paractinoplanes ovalisporus TaxID=2810368 RepID=A0ABS2AAR6_9ACTN|nr:hypothetical protein [Actinoplanes ovalisporus]MBM2616919.1 hypothetical protein [Actinoplanes ovalisporus]